MELVTQGGEVFVKTQARTAQGGALVDVLIPATTTESDPSGSYVKLTKGASAFTKGVCKALLVGTAGTATLADASGTECVDVPLQQGYNPLRALKWTAGTADNIWALY